MSPLLLLCVFVVFLFLSPPIISSSTPWSCGCGCCDNPLSSSKSCQARLQFLGYSNVESAQCSGNKGTDDQYCIKQCQTTYPNQCSDNEELASCYNMNDMEREKVEESHLEHKKIPMETNPPLYYPNLACACYCAEEDYHVNQSAIVPILKSTPPPIDDDYCCKTCFAQRNTLFPTCDVNIVGTLTGHFSLISSTDGAEYPLHTVTPNIFVDPEENSNTIYFLRIFGIDPNEQGASFQISSDPNGNNDPLQLNGPCNRNGNFTDSVVYDCGGTEFNQGYIYLQFSYSTPSNGYSSPSVYLVAESYVGNYPNGCDNPMNKRESKRNDRNNKEFRKHY